MQRLEGWEDVMLIRGLVVVVLAQLGEIPGCRVNS